RRGWGRGGGVCRGRGVLIVGGGVLGFFKEGLKKPPLLTASVAHSALPRPSLRRSPKPKRISTLAARAAQIAGSVPTGSHFALVSNLPRQRELDGEDHRQDHHRRFRLLAFAAHQLLH